MTDAVKLEPCPHCGAQMRVGERSAFHPASDDCWLGNMERGQPLELGEWDYAAWNRRAGLEAVRREERERCAKAAHDAACTFMDRSDAFVLSGPMGLALSMVNAIRALAANPQEGAAEGEGQVKI